MRGVAYGVGVGPGDAELMTLKAVRLIRSCDVIAFPGTAEASTAYGIALAAVPELAEKRLLPLDMPMTGNRERIGAAHREAAALLEDLLDQGLDVAYLTLGDPTIYSTFSYIQRILEADGYAVGLVSGVPSFCAAAARLGISLAEWDEPLYIHPAAHEPDASLDAPGTHVLMKAGRRLKAIRERLLKDECGAWMAERCGMGNERIYRGAESLPDEAGYFSLVIVKR